jgi:two-component system phosphate regulon sensor histidine kinase PhoR
VDQNNGPAQRLEQILGERFGIEILNAMGMAIVVLDPDFNIIWANKEYRKIQEKPEENIIGKKCYEISFGHNRPCTEKVCAVRRTLRTQENSKGLKIIKRGREEKHLDVYSFPLPGVQGAPNYVVEVIQDNTQLYKLVELSDRLTAFASHELKTPLATIYQLTTILEQMNLPSGKRRALFNRILSRSQHGLKTVENFLIYSRIKAAELEIVPKKVNFYRDVLENVLDFQREYTLKKGMKFICDVPKDLKVICDADYVEVIYNNLLTNAIRYGEENTEIFIGYSDQDDRYHYFSVASMGEPISEEDREVIFKRYVTTRKDGSGIGLDVARELVRKHGGRIWVEPCHFVQGKCLSGEMTDQRYKGKAKEGNNFVFTILKELKEI